MERDRLVAERVHEQALARGMRVIDVDGSRTLEDVEADVEEHLEPYLR
jgi:thymidylate kinase